MQRFFSSHAAIQVFLARVHLIRCPVCGVLGGMRRHGYIWSCLSPKVRRIRAWRVYCKPSQGGCGHAPSIRLSSSLPRRQFDTQLLWRFLDEWRNGRSVKAAWELAGSSLCLECAYAILKRLRLIQSRLRTHLWGADPPQKGAFRSTLHEVLHHLCEVYGTEDPVREVHLACQRSFLEI